MATLIRQLLEVRRIGPARRHIRVLADQLSADLASAANYVASILPGI